MNKDKIKHIFQQGGLIAYPTEAVYGLGCDPFNEAAVNKLLACKKRSRDKGLILIASSWDQIKSLIAPIDESLLKKAKASWPGPFTWIFPASTEVPKWITGKFDSVALRITAHPIAHALCELLEQPIVSTSANIEGQIPARTDAEVRKLFGDQIDYLIEGPVGSLKKPTEIRDILTDKIIRLSGENNA
ncbi:MAG: threonylcarbamoyl-AMP synthase [Proteobacteria bacterium]|nr:threonylcarbamoyl-AMP synthase [Pseudomonadota bacterium]